MAWLALNSLQNRRLYINTKTVTHIAPHPRGTKIHFNFASPGADGKPVQKAVVVKNSYKSVANGVSGKTRVMLLGLIAVAVLAYCYFFTLWPFGAGPSGL